MRSVKQDGTLDARAIAVGKVVGRVGKAWMDQDTAGRAGTVERPRRL